jgi:hypothetical protein
MTLGAEALPFSTRYDASQDPATSIDPLGTVPSADRLADALLPGRVLPASMREVMIDAE